MARAVYDWEQDGPVDLVLQQVLIKWGEFVSKTVDAPGAGTRVVFRDDVIGEGPEAHEIVYEIAYPGEEADAAFRYIVNDKKGDATGESHYLANRIAKTLPKAKHELRETGFTARGFYCSYCGRNTDHRHDHSEDTVEPLERPRGDY